jgi:hypothetical protein
MVSPNSEGRATPTDASVLFVVAVPCFPRGVVGLQRVGCVEYLSCTVAIDYRYDESDDHRDQYMSKKVEVGTLRYFKWIEGFTI